MDLIYTNASKEDLGVLDAYNLDLSFGAKENDFEITVPNDTTIESGAIVYIEGTEYGGIIDGLKTDTASETITYFGRTWHGILNSKVIEPDSGEDYLVVSGEANTVLASMIDRLGLSDLFTAVETASGVTISKYQFHRYCMGYDGIRTMLSDADAKLKVSWEGSAVSLSALPIVDYTEAPVDDDIATLSVEQHKHKVNHLICLGKGDLAEREVIHLYVDELGNIGDTQYYTGLDEVADTYENSNTDDLRKDGIVYLADLRKVDNAEINLLETDGLNYDIGDIVGATNIKTGIKVSASVTQKIIRITNGVLSTECKTGGQTISESSSGSSGGTDTSSNAVLYVDQSLTEEQKAQAQENIGIVVNEEYLNTYYDPMKLTYYDVQDGTFETVLDEILSGMAGYSAKQIQFYDTVDLIGNKFIGNLWKYTANYATLEAVSYSGLKALKRKQAGTWQPWEWENPPMSPGVEYRTTERHNGAVVYRTLIEYTNEDTIGTSGTYTQVNIPHGISGKGDTVRCDAYVGANLLPYISTDGAFTAVAAVNATNILLRTFAEWTSRTWYFDLKYTK